MSEPTAPTRLAEVLRPISRPEPVAATRQYKILGARWYARGLYIKETKQGSEIQARLLYRVEHGDFVYNRLFAWKGSFALASERDHGCHVSNEFPCFEVDDSRLDPKYLFFYFSRSQAWNEALDLSSGSTPTSRNRLKEAKFLAMELQLPPLPEQQRVVARIEALTVQLHEARALRKSASEEAEALSRAIIEAVYKRLTSKFGTSRLAEACTTIADGDHNTPPFGETGVRFIFVGNVSSGHLHFRDCKFVSAEYFKTLRPQRLPHRGDILYSAVGATLGVPPVVDSDEPFCFQRHIAILKPNPKRLDSRFGWYLLRSRTVFDSAWSATTGSAQPTIPLRAIRELPLPLPPLAEQRRIIVELDCLQGEVDKLRRLQAETTTEIDALLPSVLSRAFAGEL